MADNLLTQRQQQLQLIAREFTEKYIMPVARKHDQTGEFPWLVIEEAKKAGLHCLVVPNEYGGSEYDSLTIALIAEEWGYGCAGFATGLTGNCIAAYPLLIAGSAAQKKLYFDHIVNGHLACFALTEPSAGSDAGAIATTARPEGDEWVLNGIKCFCTNGGYASINVIFAATGYGEGVKGLSAFIVESKRDGMTVGAAEHKMGIRASNTVELQIKNVRIPRDHLLGNEGEGMQLAMQTLDMARPIVAAIGVGIAKRALHEAIGYIQSQIDYDGKPMSGHQSVRFKLADLATAIEAARQLVHYCCRLKESRAPYSKEAAMAKMFATDTAMRVTADVVEIMGSYGYSMDSVAEKLMRDAKVTQIYEGTNQIQRIVVANKLL